VNETVFNSILIFVFIIVGGVFAAAEMALVSLRGSQVKQLARRGRRGRLVSRLHENPNRFLSAVQIGVTLAGFLSAAFGGTTIADALVPVLQQWLPISHAVADTVAVVLVTAVISYVSIVLGELTAKRLALQRAESYALALAPLVDFIAKLARPVIWLLGVSTNGAVRVLGGDPNIGREEVTAEEIRALVSGSPTIGEEERRIVDEVFDAGSLRLRAVMVPRTEVNFLRGDMPAKLAVDEVREAPHSRYPVIGTSADDIIGFVHIRDLLKPRVSDSTAPIRDLARPMRVLPDSVPVLSALKELRRTSSHLAIVTDEYGGTAGIVTIEDLIERLVGDISDEYDTVEAEAVDAAGGPVIDGLDTLDDFTDQTGFILPDGPYTTVAGFFMAKLAAVPDVGEHIIVDVEAVTEDEPRRVRLELSVIEMDRHRAARFALRRLDGDQSRDPTPETNTPSAPD
jgi:putative hemolysin